MPKRRWRQEISVAETCRITAVQAECRDPQSYEIHRLFSSRRISSEMKSGSRRGLKKLPLS